MQETSLTGYSVEAPPMQPYQGMDKGGVKLLACDWPDSTFTVVSLAEIDSKANISNLLSFARRYLLQNSIQLHKPTCSIISGIILSKGRVQKKKLMD